MLTEPKFPVLDEPMPPADCGYYLPLDEWNRAVDMANWMAKVDMKSPLRRRIASYLHASNQAARND